MVQRILVTGSLNLDHTIRLHSALPACRVQAQDMGRTLGGAAANTGLALARGGHEVWVAAGLGEGAQGDRMLAELQAAGIRTDLVARLPEPPCEPLILIEPSGERTIIHRQPGQSDAVDFAALPRDWDAIYAASPAPALNQLCASLRGQCVTVGQWYPGHPAPPADLLVTSESAAATNAPQRLSDLSDPPDWLVVTLGAKGARAEGRCGRALHQPAVAVQAIDTTGAGDVFAASLIHGQLAGWPLERSLAFAAALSAQQVAGPGPTPPNSLSNIYADWSTP
jgi:sugar/nucleoside kinase (ribokinase family)